ncbi:MAG: hypothetical protein KDN05_10330, partial [Verrucomicrobiae bacterium]|nr:hypothetical protein [Verrucomicrobiae bacterium]
AKPAAGLSFLTIMTTKQTTLIAVATVLVCATIPVAVISTRKHPPSQETDAADTRATTVDRAFPTASSRPETEAAPTSGQPALNWAKIARTKFGTRNQTMLNKASAELLETLGGLSTDELASSLEEVTALDLDISTKVQLRSLIIAHLAERDPLLVLDRFPLEKAQGMLTLSLGPAFDILVSRDLPQAEEWLEKQVAAGNLQTTGDQPSDTNTWMMFESAIVEKQLRTDPESAVSRIVKLPPAQQPQILIRAAGLDYPAAFEIALDQCQSTGDPALLGGMLSPHLLVHGLDHDGGNEAELHTLIDRVPDPDLRAAGHQHLSKLAATPMEGIPLDLILEGEKE